MSKEMIFQDGRCLGDACRMKSNERVRLRTLAETHPGNVAVGICFERSMLSSCNLEVLGQFTPDKAEELRAVFTEKPDIHVDTDES